MNINEVMNIDNSDVCDADWSVSMTSRVPHVRLIRWLRCRRCRSRDLLVLVAMVMTTLFVSPAFFRAHQLSAADLDVE